MCTLLFEIAEELSPKVSLHTGVVYVTVTILILLNQF